MKINTLGLNENQNVKKREKSNFWKRQFQNDSTYEQKVFDWFFGVVLPVICFVFDPIVFKGEGIMGGEMFGIIKPFSYLLSFVSIMAMMAWLIWGEKLKWANAILAGLFGVGGLISLGIGIVLLPFSLLGLFVIIGILGFTPFFTSVVYLRNAVRAFQTAKSFLAQRTLLGTAILAAMFNFVVPFTVNVEINKWLEQVKNGNSETIRNSTWKLRLFAPIVPTQQIVLSFNQSWEDTEKCLALSELYLKLTGEDIRERADRLAND